MRRHFLFLSLAALLAACIAVTALVARGAGRAEVGAAAAVLLAALAGLLWWDVAGRYRLAEVDRQRGGHARRCPRCRYDLTGNVSGT